MIDLQKCYAHGNCHLSNVYKSSIEYYRIYNLIKSIFDEKYLLLMTDILMLEKKLVNITSNHKEKIEKLFIEEGYSLNNIDDLKFLLDIINGENK